MQVTIRAASLLTVVLYWTGASAAPVRSSWDLVWELQSQLATSRADNRVTPAHQSLLSAFAAEVAQDRYPSSTRLRNLAEGLSRGSPAVAVLAKPLQALAEHWSDVENSSLAYICRAAVCPGPWPESSIAEQRILLRAALDRFAVKLATFGNLRVRWEQHLLWPETQQLLESSSFDLALLDRLEARWTNVALAWNDPELAHTAFAVRRFVEQARREVDPTFHLRALNSLGVLACLSFEDEAAIAESHARLAMILGDLEPYGIVPELTIAIRRRCSHPNAVVRLSPKLLRLDRHVDENFPINEAFAGSQAVGNGRLTGKLAWETRDIPGVAGWNWSFQATSIANTRSSSQGVLVQSRSTTQLRGSKAFLWDAAGLSALPAKADATTAIEFTNIDSGGGQRRRDAASSNVYATRPQAQADSTASARRSLRARLDLEGQKLLEAFQRPYETVIRTPLGVSTKFVTTIHTETMGSEFGWYCWLEPPHGLAAPIACPPRPEDAAATTSWHESFVERLAAVRFAGRELTATEFTAEMNRLRGIKLPKAPKDVADPWSIRFATDRPIVCHFDDGEIHLNLRLSEFTAADSVYPSISVRLLFRPQLSPNGWVLIKDAPVEVFPLDYEPGSGQRLTGRQLSLRLAVQRKLEESLAEVFAATPLNVRWSDSASPTVEPYDVDVAAQWLTISWKVGSGKQLKKEVDRRTLSVVPGN